MRSMILALTAATVVPAVHAQTSASRQASQKGWYSELAPAMAEAKRSGKPLMVVFRCDP